MNDKTYLIKMLHALKGAPLSCMFALELFETPITTRQICTATGYSRDEVLQGLVLLSVFRIIEQRDDGRWMLTPRMTLDLHNVFPEHINPN